MNFSKRPIGYNVHARIRSTNPAKNYALLGEVAVSTDSEIKGKGEKANNAKLSWKELGAKKRIVLLKPIFAEFSKRKEDFARLITSEVGKPIRESEEEMRESLEVYFEWFLENADAALKDEVVFRDSKNAHKIVYEPLGTAVVITPWNFPFETFVWGVIPNLLAGNTVVFKASEECPLAGKMIEEVMLSHGLPEGVFSEVYGAGGVGEKLARGKIDLIWFTGSSRVGKKLYKIAAGKFVNAILEMGGSNAGIVFEGASVEDSIPKLYEKRFGNCGQTCDALKRLIVHQSIFREVIEKLKGHVERMVVGDPQSRSTDIGSLVAKRQLDLLEAQVKDALEKGATVVTGGRKPNGLKGAYYLPTILTDIKPTMAVWKEEVFGPVLSIMPFKTEEEAIRLANDSQYGLGATVFMEDKERAKRVASRLATGTVEINSASHWQACSPFGGYKQSGMGREHGIYGFRELCQ